MPSHSDPVSPQMPSRALTLDQAYERGYRAMRDAAYAVFDGCGAPHHDELQKVREAESRLTQDLIEAGVGGTFAYQLARPPSPE